MPINALLSGNLLPQSLLGVTTGHDRTLLVAPAPMAFAVRHP